jgi:tetratricopeptide (TPR) repeat protein
MAILYGQLGNTNMMIEKFLNEAYSNPQSSIMIQNQLSRFMTEDANEMFNETLRKALLVRAQKNQDVFWNEYLSWFYVQQKEYGKAFIQEKAIYKRNPETFSNIVNLAQLAIEEKEQETAKEILTFVLDNTKDLELPTQLIANDALELFLLINDNTVADSTQIALKKFAKADFLLYQNKNQEALVQFQQIVKEHKGDVIEDVTLLRIGKTYEQLADFTTALSFYQQIIDNFPESIYRDEALFFSAELYNKQLNQPEKAKTLYEAVLFNHQDSIYYVEARKKFRQLRGDSNL